MISYLPGTTIEIELSDGRAACLMLDNIFLGGGLVLSQVAQLTGLEQYVIQNWIKRGFLSPPQKKLYSKDQFCRIVTINMLRDSLRLDEICGLISFVNGRLDDDSDNLLSDSELYYYYIMLLANTLRGDSVSTASDKVLEGFTERMPGARKRVSSVLEIMYNAHSASVFRKRAEMMLGQINNQ